MSNKDLIGKVAHYYGNVGVAVIELSGNLKAGERIKFLGKTTDFEQEVDSMEVEREKITEATAGSSVGLKVDQKAKKGCKVYKV